MKGIVYGVLATIAAVAVVIPLISASTANPAGIFFTNTPMPGAMLLGLWRGTWATGSLSDLPTPRPTRRDARGRRACLCAGSSNQLARNRGDSR